MRLLRGGLSHLMITVIIIFILNIFEIEVFHLKERKDITQDEYKLETNENGEKVIKEFNEQNNQEINIIFEKNETDVMTEVLKQLSKYYIEEILKKEM